MAEYIDREKIFPNGVFYVSAENPESSLTELINRICNLPTADVVPNSEVERLKRADEGSQKTIKGLTEMIREKNKELTKLETHLELHYGEKSLNNLIAEQRADIAREIFEEIESKKMFLKDCVGNMGVVVLFKDISELKKKYTEEKK